MAGATAVAAAASINSAADFQDKLAIINTIAHQTPAELNATGEAIRAMAVASGAPLSDLTSAFYDLLSAGVPVSQAMSVLGSSVTLAIGGLATTKQTVDLLTTAMNAYGLTAAGVATATDQFARAIQDGKVTADQIAGSFADIAPLAKTAGVGIDEIAASYAVMTARGVPAAEVTTQMNRAIIELLKPNANLIALQKETGVVFADVAREQGLVVALQAMREAANAADVPFQNLFGRLEGLKFALSTTGPEFTRYRDELTAMQDTTGTAAAQAAERMGTFNRQTAILGNSLQDLAINLGSAFLPQITAFVESISSAVQGVSAWANANPELASTLLVVVGGVSALVAAIVLVSGAIGALLSPIGLVIAAVAGIGIAFATNFGGVRDVVEAMAAAVGSAIGVVVSLIGQIVNFVTSAGVVRGVVDGINVGLGILRGAFDAIVAVVSTVVGWITTFLTHLLGVNASTNATRGIFNGLAGVLSTVAGIFGTIVSVISTVVTAIIDAGNRTGFFRGVLDALGVAGRVINTIFGLLGDVLRVLVTIVGQVAGIVGGALSTAFNVIRGVVDAIIGVFRGLIDVIGGAIDALRTFLGLDRSAADVAATDAARAARGAPPISGGTRAPGYASGGIVPGPIGEPQLAIVHGGETVTPPGQTSAVRSIVNHIHVHLDGRQIAEVIDERIFNSASVFSSGFVGAGAEP